MSKANTDAGKERRHLISPPFPSTSPRGQFPRIGATNIPGVTCSSILFLCLAFDMGKVFTYDEGRLIFKGVSYQFTDSIPSLTASFGRQLLGCALWQCL